MNTVVRCWTLAQAGGGAFVSYNAVKEKKYVLIVEDDPEIRSIYQDLFSDIEVDGKPVIFIEAIDGREGIQKILMQNFSCILTDLNMPRVVGDEVIAAARRSPYNKNTPLLVITGYPNEKLSEDFDHLTQIAKPFKPDDLIKMIQTQLRLGPVNKRISGKKFQLVIEESIKLVGNWLGNQVKSEGKRPVYPNSESVAGECLVFRINLNSESHYFGLTFGPEVAQMVSSLPWRDQVQKLVTSISARFKEPDTTRVEVETEWLKSGTQLTTSALVAGRKAIAEKISHNGQWIECLAFQP